MVSMLEFGGAKMPLDRNTNTRIHFNLGLGDGGMLDSLDLDLDEKSNRETIHSGHFMVSEIDDSKVQEEEDEASLLAPNVDDTDQVVLTPKPEEINLQTHLPDVSMGAAAGLPTSGDSNMQLATFNPAGIVQSISIDDSLTNLLKCMSLVYSGKLTSPRWKTFKGVKMRLKEKIRLNNIIWRAWHLQFVAKRKPFVCQFASPLEGETRNKPEAVVLEGKYLKRGIKTVVAEYKKCRMFYRDRMRCLKYMENNSTTAMDLDFRFPSWSNSSLASGLDDDITNMDFTDTLFASLIPSEPFDFPNPREIARAGIADLIQPGLVQLQPSLDDFMDTLEPLHDFFQSRPLATLPEEGPLSDSLKQMPPVNSSMDNNNLLSNMNFSSVINAQMAAAPPPPSYPSQLASNRTQNNGNQLSKAKERILKPSTLQQQQPVFSNDSFSNSNVGLVSPLMGNQSMDTPSSFTPETVLQSPTASGGSHLSQLPVVDAAASASGIKLMPRSLSPGPQTATASVFFPKHKGKTVGYPGSPVRRSVPTTQPNMRSLIQPKMINKSQSLVNSNSILKPPKPSSQILTDSLKSRSFASSSSYTTDQLVKNSNSSLININRQNTSPVHSSQLLGSLNSIAIAPPSNAHTFQVLSLQQQQQTQQQQQQQQGQIAEEPFKFNAPAHMLTKTRRNTVRMDTPGYRRHSYTGHLTPGFSAENLQMKSPVASNQNESQKEVQFAVPKGQVVKQRARSRSVSSPQHTSGSLKAISAKPPQAISLTNINLNNQPTVQPILSAAPQNIQPMPTSQMPQLLPMGMSMSPISPITTTTNNRLRTNTVLAQLLSTAYSTTPDGTSSSSSTSNTNPTVTIIGTVPPTSSGPQTLVLSPVTLTTMPGVSEIQNTLLVGSSGSVSLTSQKLLPVSATSGVTLGGAQKPGSSESSSQASSHTPKIFRPKSSEEKIQYKEHKRVCHINAEQKRRCNIKHGFEALHVLVPSLCHNPSSKVSKAAMLQKSVDYIRSLKAERTHQISEAEKLKKEIDELNQTINTYQNQLPASGAPVPFQRTNHMRERFDEYVKSNTLQNWKFWIFSLLMDPLLESYTNTVSTANMDDLCKTTITWLEQHCSLALLRPMVLNSLTHLCTTTNILSDPSRLPEEATRAIAKKEKKNSQK